MEGVVYGGSGLWREWRMEGVAHGGEWRMEGSGAWREWSMGGVAQTLSSTLPDFWSYLGCSCFSFGLTFSLQFFDML